MSARRAQAVHRYGNQPTDSSLGALTPGSAEGVHAVARELVGRHIVSDFPGVRGRRHKVPDQVVNLTLGPPDLVLSMKQPTCKSSTPDLALPPVPGDPGGPRLQSDQLPDRLAGVPALARASNSRPSRMRVRITPTASK